MTYRQEEIDEHLLLHAAKEGYQAVVICSEDTGVFILSLVFHDKIGILIFQKYGTKMSKKLIDIRKAAATLGIDACRVLIGMHAYTGFDDVSDFAGKRKAKALKLLNTNKEMRQF